METLPLILGLHHVTAMTADAQANVNFYTGVLGLRLVKLTVNFDDPSSYHIYYGDELGRPGSAMTFFAWPGATRGRIGAPQVVATAFSIPHGSLSFWAGQLKTANIDVTPIVRFGDNGMAFLDPDGLPLELIETGADNRAFWQAGPIAAEHAIRGFHSVTLRERSLDSTTTILNHLELITAAPSEDRHRFVAGAAVPGGFIDALPPGTTRGEFGAGVVHHVALRVADDAAQEAWRERLVALGLGVSPVMERVYFRSIYFRGPGGVLFEIATDQPGFTADESADTLGTRIALPPWLESQRSAILSSLPTIRLPDGNIVGGAQDLS